MHRLQTFTAYELNLLVCGEQTPNWTREDIVNFTEPKYGYTKDRYVDDQPLFRWTVYDLVTYRSMCICSSQKRPCCFLGGL